MNGRKRHLLVDSQGRLLQVLVHPARALLIWFDLLMIGRQSVFLSCIRIIPIENRSNIPEREGARMLLEKLSFPAGRLKLIWADAGYNGPEFSGWVKEQHDIRVEIVSKIASTDFEVLPRRWVVERTFGWWNKWRRLSKDYEQNPRSSEVWIHIVMIAILLNRVK